MNILTCTYTHNSQGNIRLSLLPDIFVFAVAINQTTLLFTINKTNQMGARKFVVIDAFLLQSRPGLPRQDTINWSQVK